VSGALERVVAEVRAEGGLLSQAVLDAPASEERLGALAAAGPRSRGREQDVAFVVEAIHEGYLLHYGQGRLLGADDADLALLAGDRLYALGLARLAAAADLDAVRALADLIALSAQARAAGDKALADAVWAAGCAEVGWGPDPALDGAKDAARAGESDAAERLRAAARRLAGDLAPAH
jgi:hypothetical protein